MSPLAGTRHVASRSIVVGLAIVLFFQGIVVSVAQAPETQVFVAHRARLSAEIPAEWTIPADGNADYSGPDGFVTSIISPGDELASACDSLGAILPLDELSSEMMDRSGNESCRFDGMLRGQDAAGVLVEHPEPFDVNGVTIRLVGLVADANNFPSILESMSFDSSIVTPQLYAWSILDLMEARAWFSNEVDWERLREDLPGLIEYAETYEEVHWVIREAISQLHVAGDNHSFFYVSMEAFDSRLTPATGLVLRGRMVYFVYPDSPAGRTDLRVGDTIKAVNGMPFNGIQPIDYVVSGDATLTVSRSGVSEPFEVEIAAESFEAYLPPRILTLDEIGYIELFNTIGSDPELYVTDARDGIAAIDQDVACGWIVDLRRNGGGSYSPMVLGIGGLLEDGQLVTYVRRDGEVVGRVAYRDGMVYQDGRAVMDPGRLPGTVSIAPSPPLAVLIGPGTGSAGEVATASLIGRPETRMFGSATAGLTIGNNPYILFDGAILGLAESTYADRTGETHIGGIVPDVVVETDWAAYGTMDDPVVAEASAWLKAQSGCDTATPTIQVDRQSSRQ